MAKLNLIMAISLLTAAFNAQAFVGLPCKKSQFDKLSDFVQKTKVFGTDDRKTFDEYAAEHGVPASTIEKKFAATGIIDCGEGSGQTTAQLTGSSSVITTARHYFRGLDCADKPSLNSKKCWFYTHDGSGWNDAHEVDMSSLKLGECSTNSFEGDWAVLKLKRSVKGIRPYRADKVPENVNENIEVVNPAAFSADFKVNNAYPRVINDCSVTRIDNLARTTCDTGVGASGSANLKDSQRGLSVVAIVIGTSDNSGREVNLSTPLKGDFYNAVKTAARQTQTASADSDSDNSGI